MCRGLPRVWRAEQRRRAATAARRRAPGQRERPLRSGRSRCPGRAARAFARLKHRAQPLADKLAGYAMTLDVPVAESNLAVRKTVQEGVTRLRVLVQRLGERQHVEAVALAERGDSAVGIEQVADADALHEILAHLRVGPYLDAGVERHGQKRRSVPRGLAMRFCHQVVGDLPGVAPRLLSGRLVDVVVDRAFDRQFGGRLFVAGAKDRPGSADQREQPGFAIVEARHTPQAKRIRALKRAGWRELAITLDVKRPAQIAFERDRVVAHVVAEKNREHHDVRLVGPHLLAQRHQFLRGAVPVDAEVERFDAPSLEQWALRELARRDRGESVLIRHLDRFGVGIAEHRDTDGAGRLGLGKLGAAKAAAVDLDVGGALAPIVTGGVRPQPPSTRGVVTIEVGKKAVGDSYADFGNQPRADHAEDDQRRCAQRPTNHAMSP